MPRLVLPSALAVCLASALAADQQPPPAPPARSALIIGHVVDAVTNKAVDGATVTLTRRPVPNEPRNQPNLTRVIGDGTGGFVFAGLTAGTYDIIASKPGYVSGALGKLRPNGGGTSLVLGPEDRPADIAIRMWPHGSITGSVVDEAGEPVVGVEVLAFRREWLSGRSTLVWASSYPNATTDDRGMYRLGSLGPGDYVVAVPAAQTTLPAELYEDLGRAAATPALRSALVGATPLGTRNNQRVDNHVLQGSPRSMVNPGPSAAGRISVYPTTFYGRATEPRNATLVKVAAGQRVSLPALQVEPVATVRVSGTLTGPSGPVPLTRVALIPQFSDEFSSDGALNGAHRTVTDSRGSFTFLGVPPGRYTLRSKRGSVATDDGPPPPPVEPNTWLADPVTVGNQNVELHATLKPAFTVSGRVVFNGQNPPAPDLRRRSDVVSLEPADARQRGIENFYTPRTDRDDAFSITGFQAGRYVVRAGVPGWALESITWQGRDVIDKAIDVHEDLRDLVITFTDRPAGIRGVATGANGGPASDALVIVYPIDPQLRAEFGYAPQRSRTARGDGKGAFVLSAIPPGDYFLVAITEAAAGEWSNPATLEALSRAAARVHIDVGTVVTQNLTLQEIR